MLIRLFLLATLGLPALAQPQRELIFALGSTSFPSSHASTVVELEMTYTWNRKSIQHVQVPLASLPK